MRKWTPQGDFPPEKAVLLLHGVESHSEWFEDVAPYLVNKGFSVYAPDRSGWGKSPGLRGHMESYENAMNLIDCVSEELHKTHKEIHCSGLSWGGKFALYAALRRPYLFDSLTLIAPGLVPQCQMALGKKIFIALNIITGNGKGMVKLPINDEEFTSKNDKLGYIKSDNYRIKSVSSSFCLESLKMDKFIEEHINQLRIPAQLLLAGNDKIINNAATSKLFSLNGSFDTRKIIHESTEHSLVFETPERTASEISEWITLEHKQNPEKKKVLIMGAGAVGSTVGGLLAKGGHNVTLVCRQAHADAVNNNGLKLTIGTSSRIIKQNLTAITEIKENSETYDLIIMCVKNFDTESSLNDIRPAVDDKTIILSLQNGVGNERKIASVYPENPVVCGAICGYLSFESAGHIILQSDKGGLAVGPLRESDAAAASLADAVLSDSGMQVFYNASGEEIKWSKLMLNVAFNAINAMTGLGTSQIMSDSVLGPLAVRTFAECAEVMERKNITPFALPSYPADKLAKVMSMPQFIARKILAKTTAKEAKGKSSMAQDLAKGRGKNEIMEINGQVVSAAEELGIKAEANLFLLEKLQEVMRSPELLEKYKNRPASLAAGFVL
jgi:2-dehydropantoate 2-reductase